MSQIVDQYALDLACPYCRAQPSFQCRTSSGRYAHYLHSDRTWQVYSAWVAGYQKGEGDVLAYVRRMDKDEVLSWHARILDGRSY